MNPNLRVDLLTDKPLFPKIRISWIPDILFEIADDGVKVNQQLKTDSKLYKVTDWHTFCILKWAQMLVVLTPN